MSQPDYILKYLTQGRIRLAGAVAAIGLFVFWFLVFCILAVATGILAIPAIYLIGGTLLVWSSMRLADNGLVGTGTSCLLIGAAGIWHGARIGGWL